MSRISYRCLEQERGTPTAQKTFWYVYRDGKQCGYIESDDTVRHVSPTLRIWQPVLFEQEFNAMEFPHADDPLEVNEPYVCTNDEDDCDHQLELRTNTKMTLNEARSFIHHITRRRN